MPELPEVETTVRGLRKAITSLIIKNVWTDLFTKDKRQRDSVANPRFFNFFRKEVLNKKILSVKRRAKNILINISEDQTILIHMKMTGHLLCGKYKFVNKKWIPDENQRNSLRDPRNRFIHFVFSFKNGRHLAFSDARKFGKITLLHTATMHNSKYLKNIGPEPLNKNFTLEKLRGCLNKKPNGKIQTVLMDQSIVAGIGNIYSNEILWRASVHPERKVKDIKSKELKSMLRAIKEILAKGISFGGDSIADYRNIHGQPGKFQTRHQAYGRIGEKCRKKNCKGIIQRKVIAGRSAHFCPIHQK